MDNQLKLVVKSILEADEKASARRIISQLPNIQKAVNAAGKLKLKLELDESSVKQLSSLKSALNDIQNVSRGGSSENISSRFTKGISGTESKIASLQRMLTFDHLSDGTTGGIASLRAELEKLEASCWRCLDTFNNSPKTPETYAHLTKELDNLRTSFQSASTQARIFGGTLASEMKLDRLASDIRSAQNSLQTLGTEWSSLKSNPQLLSEFDALTAKAKELDAVNLTNFSNEVNEFSARVKSAGLNTLSFGDAAKNAFTKFTEWFSVASIVKGTVQQIQNIIQSVIDLDGSLTELQKVTDLTGSSLEGFVKKSFDMGDSIGRTGKEVIDAATVFKRAGYDLNESMSLAEASLVMTNVGDGIKDVTTASSALIAVLKGFKMNDTDAMGIVDAINETSNHAAIDFDNITEGLRRVSGTISQTGTSLAETIGLLTGGFGQLRNIENVSSGLTFISQRLRGIDEDGKAIDGLVPKLQKDFKEIAGIDIEDTNGELRSTYDILRDMARVFPTLSSQQQQYLGEMAAGNVAPHAAKAA